MKKIPGIYIIINVLNNKVYVGQSVNVLARTVSHWAYFRSGKHHNAHIQSAFNKYGENSFRIDILEKCEIYELDEKEKYYIEKYKSTDCNFGYNKESGGSLNKKVSIESRKKLSETKKKWKPSKEHLRKLHEGGKKSNSIRFVSLETRSKMREYRLNNPVSPETRKKISASLRGKFTGELNPSSIISNDQARSIKSALYCGLQMKEVCDIFNVSMGIVKGIKNCKRWVTILPELNEELINRLSNWKKDTREEIKRLFLLGHSQADISREMNILTSKTCIILKELKLTRTKQEQFLLDNVKNIIEAKKLIDSGCSIREVERTFGFTYRTIKKYVLDA